MTMRRALIGIALLALIAVVIARRSSCEGCKQRAAKLSSFLGGDNGNS